MSSPAPSVIAITYDGADITNYVLFESARFECQANAVPGTFQFTVKDEARTLSFGTGKLITLWVDGIKMFTGIVMRVGRSYAFPADDTTNLSSVKTRQWVLEGTDLNIYFDKRVIRNPADYFKPIVLTGVFTDRELIVNELPNYIDVPPDMDITTFVDQVADTFGVRDNNGLVIANKEYALPPQGSYWRRFMDELAARSAAVYYIDGDRNLHFHGLEKVVAPWSFVDRGHDGVTRVGIRDVTASEDGSMIVTDALVWGGLEVENSIVFARYPDSSFVDVAGSPLWVGALTMPVLAAATTFGVRSTDPTPTVPFELRMGGTETATVTAITPLSAGEFSVTATRATPLDHPAGEEVRHDAVAGFHVDRQEMASARMAQLTYGRWQLAESHFDNTMDQAFVNLRAKTIIMGPPGAAAEGPSGLRFPLWQFHFSWFAHDVPGAQHLLPGYVVTIVLSVMGDDLAHPLVRTLPLRNVVVTFPQLAGNGLAWVRFEGDFGISYTDSRHLWRFLLQQRNSRPAIPSTVGAPQAGRTVTGSPSQAADGTTTTFTAPSHYLENTLRVYLNGLYQREGFEWQRGDPATGTFRFFTAPVAGDEIYVELKTR